MSHSYSYLVSVGVIGALLAHGSAANATPPTASFGPVADDAPPAAAPPTPAPSAVSTPPPARAAAIPSYGSPQPSYADQSSQYADQPVQPTYAAPTASPWSPGNPYYEPMADQPGPPQPKTDAHGPMFSIEAVTNAPIDIGGRLTYQGEAGFRIATGVGVVPRPYFTLVTNGVERFGGIDSAEEKAVAKGLDSGFAWRTQVGYRTSVGIYLDAGYSYISIGGRLSAADVNLSDGLGDRAFDLRSKMHTWVAEIGWQSENDDRLVFGIGVGMIGVVAASSSAKPNFAEGDQPRVQRVSSRAVTSFDKGVEKYGYVPTLTLRLGFDTL